MEGVITHVTQKYTVVTFKPIKITQIGPFIENLGKKYIFVIIYYTHPCDIALIVAEGSFLT